MQYQLNEAVAIVEMELPIIAGPDLSETLREIRLQYEIMGQANRDEAEAKYKLKVRMDDMF